MVVVRIEHQVPDYTTWKQAFDSDPVGREQSGVLRYRILRAIDDPNYVMIDLEFDSVERAEAFVGSMQGVWGRVQGMLISDPRARIAEPDEAKDYRASD
ncbi:hypothetical protein BH18ACT17_BH18ACT17_07380 [soil metagenome]